MINSPSTNSPIDNIGLHPLDELADRVHRANERWWRDPATHILIQRNIGELLMLCVSELSEAMEGNRKGLMDDKLPQYDMFSVELVDCIIRIFDIAGVLVPNLGAIFEAKMAYNASRYDHTNEARLKDGGKKY